VHAIRTPQAIVCTNRDITIPVFLLAFAFTICCGVRAGNVVLLPEDFEGWIVIRYNVSGADALEREGIKVVIKVLMSGAISTSSERASGYGLDAYYFVDANGRRRPIPSEADGCKNDERCARQFQFFTSPSTITVFFVGTKQALFQSSPPVVQ
jgi:hypothetical protein